MPSQLTLFCLLVDEVDACLLEFERLWLLLERVERLRAVWLLRDDLDWDDLDWDDLAFDEFELEPLNSTSSRPLESPLGIFWCW